MTTSVPRAIALMYLLVAADLATKELLITPEWAWHPQSGSWQLHAFFAAIVFICLIRFRFHRFTYALIAGAIYGQFVSSFNPEGIANPFVMAYGDSIVAFNLADVYLVLAAPVFLLTAAHHLIHDRERQPA